MGIGREVSQTIIKMEQVPENQLLQQNAIQALKGKMGKTNQKPPISKDQQLYLTK